MRRTYEFSIRGDQVRGIYCTYCADDEDDASFCRWQVRREWHHVRNNTSECRWQDCVSGPGESPL